jgi:hypothetical protein
LILAQQNVSDFISTLRDTKVTFIRNTSTPLVIPFAIYPICSCLQ